MEVFLERRIWSLCEGREGIFGMEFGVGVFLRLTLESEEVFFLFIDRSKFLNYIFENIFLRKRVFFFRIYDIENFYFIFFLCL